MTNSEQATEIRIGITDGFRFIGIRPPLDDNEVAALVEAGHIRDGSQIEDIDVGPHCSLIRFSSMLEGGPLQCIDVTASAEQIAETLRPLRGIVHLDKRPIPLWGYKSSPYNPTTE